MASAEDAADDDDDASPLYFCRLPRFRRSQDRRRESTIVFLVASCVLSTV